MSANEFAKVIQEFLSTHCYDDSDCEVLDSRKVWQKVYVL